ncbi:FG-GAP repeat protein [Nocardioides sp. MAHUQ-72]|uniref:FG-GAP and VCBS repeat-containing protein n=1 Tax=unclassified Nocardioides TaxID=2615069 RepID=UPI00360C9E07
MRPLLVAGAGALLLLPVVASAGGAGPGGQRHAAATSLRADFDGDGFGDLAVAAPGERPGGAVHVLYGSAAGLTARGDQVWSQGSRGVPGRPERGDEFGASLAVGDLDGDGRADLAIGVPGEGHAGTAVNGPGVVEVLYGSPRGLTASHSQLWSQDSAGVAGRAEPRDAFGTALAVADLGAGRRTDLAVGVPGENGSRGVVQVLTGSPRGLSSGHSQRWSLDSPGVPGAARRGDGFGGALAAGDLDGDRHADLAIGSARADVRGADGAGVVSVVYGARAGLTSAGAQRWTQDSRGVAGTAETEDWFGGALTVANFDGDRRDDLAVGVAGETLAVVAEAAGAVNVLYGTASGVTAADDQLWTEDSPGVADISQPREELGAAVTAGDFDGDGHADLAVGVPFQSLGDPSTLVPDAGTVHMLRGSAAGLTATGSQLWSQDSPGVPGRAEESDRFGSALGTGDLDADGRSDLSVGSPGESVGGDFGAGAVHVLAGSPSGLTSAGSRQWSQDSPGVAGTPGRTDFFGWALSSSAGD